MDTKLLLGIAVFISVQDVFLLEYDEYTYEDETYEPLSCSVAESIKDGHVTYSQGGLEGSVLTYHCNPGQYPFPVSSRLCGAGGAWSSMRLPNGRQVSLAKCKDILCPAQLQLDQGDFWPRAQWLPVGATQSFSCQEGFTLHGSAQRTCTLSGEWTGTTPVCDNHADDCDDPGVPPGAQRSAGRFYVGEKVSYQCQAGLDLLGSAERFCLHGREWSGSTPRCQGPQTFDSPSDVAAAMTGSLAGVLDVLSPASKKTDAKINFARSFRVAEGSRMHVYILLDTSGSISQQDFNISRDATIDLIRKLDSYEVQMNFHVLSFASEVKDIVDIKDSAISGSVDDVIWRLMEFDYNSHGRKTGTNLHAALKRVNEAISFFKRHRDTNHFNETQNIIIVETDGYSNTGSRPQIAMAQIRNLLGYQHTSQDHTDEMLLDVYVFGIGTKVKRDELNSLASKKRGEQHVFVLKDFHSLGQMFNSIISDESVTMCGVAQEEEASEVHARPWHVTVTSSVSCFGSIVSPNWVLTAAHCFARASTENVPQQVEIKHGGGRVLSKSVIMHPDFNINALKHRNVSEFYDYDVALVQLNTSIPLSRKARPICLPCTVPASRAMKRVNSTCQQHREELLSHTETAASFIHSHKKPERKETHIHTQSQRRSCVEKARTTLTEPTDVTLEEYVPDRFLCSGGSDGHQDAISCKGDSGGALFLRRRNRYFQVGILSWGSVDLCGPLSSARRRHSSDTPPPDARDFHIDLFKITGWLKKHLGKDIQLLPEFD
ncbi:complement C2 [Antennarius striatus]|uniref:complement C2 n=1 Tax=Antennarius striatus TaxID=241820 RepID=UPI0035B1B03B